jgi:two-component sensor histidine kinase
MNFTRALRGLPADFDMAKSQSLGARIMHSLAEQLGGQLRGSADKGTTTRLVFSA